MNVGAILLKLWSNSGFAAIITGFLSNNGWQNLVMLAIACVLLYLAIVKKFEPLLLVGIAFGCLLTNLPNAGLYHQDLWTALWTPPAPCITASARSCGRAACWTSSTSVSRPACIPA